MVGQVLRLLVSKEVSPKGYLVEADQAGILVEQAFPRLVEDFMFGIDDRRRDRRWNAVEKRIIRINLGFDIQNPRIT